jgi:hypothetical protein
VEGRGSEGRQVQGLRAARLGGAGPEGARGLPPRLGGDGHVQAEHARWPPPPPTMAEASQAGASRHMHGSCRAATHVVTAQGGDGDLAAVQLGGGHRPGDDSTDQAANGTGNGAHGGAVAPGDGEGHGGDGGADHHTHELREGGGGEERPGWVRIGLSWGRGAAGAAGGALRARTAPRGHSSTPQHCGPPSAAAARRLWPRASCAAATHQVHPAQGQADLEQHDGEDAGQDAIDNDHHAGHQDDLLAGGLLVDVAAGRAGGGNSSREVRRGGGEGGRAGDVLLMYLRGGREGG